MKRSLRCLLKQADDGLGLAILPSFEDGTFDTDGPYRGDGSYLREFQDRELNNRFVMVPGNRVTWKNTAARCADEFEGFYAKGAPALFDSAVLGCADRRGRACGSSADDQNSHSLAHLVTSHKPIHHPASAQYLISNADRRERRAEKVELREQTMSVEYWICHDSSNGQGLRQPSNPRARQPRS